MQTKYSPSSNSEQVNDGYIRLPELKQILQWSASTIWRKSRNSTFVRPVKLSERITAWPRAEVRAWLAAKGAAK